MSSRRPDTRRGSHRAASGGGNGPLIVLLVLVVLLGAGAYYLVNGSGTSQTRDVAVATTPTAVAGGASQRPSGAASGPTGAAAGPGESPSLLPSGDAATTGDDGSGGTGTDGAGSGGTGSGDATATSATGRPSIVVLNQTSTSGLAARLGARAAATGWTVARTGNFTGRVPATTVYYPAGMSAWAQQLAAELGISRVRAAFSGISTSSLTVILAEQGGNVGDSSGAGSPSGGTPGSSVGGTSTPASTGTDSSSASPAPSASASGGASAPGTSSAAPSRSSGLGATPSA